MDTVWTDFACLLDVPREARARMMQRARAPWLRADTTARRRAARPPADVYARARDRETAARKIYLRAREACPQRTVVLYMDARPPCAAAISTRVTLACARRLDPLWLCSTIRHQHDDRLSLDTTWTLSLSSHKDRGPTLHLPKHVWTSDAFGAHMAHIRETLGDLVGDAHQQRNAARCIVQSSLHADRRLWCAWHVVAQLSAAQIKQLAHGDKTDEAQTALRWILSAGGNRARLAPIVTAPRRASRDTLALLQRHWLCVCALCGYSLRRRDDTRWCVALAQRTVAAQDRDALFCFVTAACGCALRYHGRCYRLYCALAPDDVRRERLCLECYDDTYHRQPRGARVAVVPYKDEAHALCTVLPCDTCCTPLAS